MCLTVPRRYNSAEFLTQNPEFFALKVKTVQEINNLRINLRFRVVQPDEVTVLRTLK